MQAHMPRKYWRNLPEAELIAPLIAAAPTATQQMIDHAPTIPKLRAPKTHLLPQRQARDGGGLAATRDAACRCTACPLYAHATQTVFGEGPEHAEIMFVGEQPGDQEDLAGRPFVGPAGQLFDRALGEAGIERAGVYVTNAVKHFKFEPRGKRRIHKTPAQQEIEACRPWLEREIALVQPKLIVALGGTAANALLGKPTPIQRNRGRCLPVSADTQALITVHPSYLLRVPEERKAEEYARFVEDLRLVAKSVVRASAPALPAYARHER
jgi:DNA polymerase